MINIPLILTYLIPALKSLGGILLGILMQLLAGRTLKKLIVWPLEAWSKKTKNIKDDELVSDAKKDLGLE